MILCSCNVLTVARLLDAAATLSAADPSRPVTAGRVLREIGVRPRCGTCLTLIRDIFRNAGFMITCPEPLAGIADSLSVFELSVVSIEMISVTVTERAEEPSQAALVPAE